MSNQSIADAIAAAQQAAANSVPANVPASMGSTAVGAPVAAGAPLGLDDMMAGGVSVDHWLKLTADGIKIGDKTKPLDTIEVYLDMSEIAYNFSVKYNVNGTAVYHKTYDRVTDAQGGPWIATMQKAQSIDPKAYEYRSAEIPFVLAADVESKTKGELAAAAGDRLGLTLSTTGWKKFQDFVRDLARKGIDAKSASVKFTLGYETKQKAGVNDWGVPTFLKVEEVDVIPVLGTIH
ncbi:hypothetical protein ACCS91_33645 [Rhizobium ruizarguesonis]